MFCDKTGVYLPAPHKPRREAWHLQIHGDVVAVYLSPGLNPDAYARLIRVVRNDVALTVVETTNSVYVRCGTRAL